MARSLDVFLQQHPTGTGRVALVDPATGTVLAHGTLENTCLSAGERRPRHWSGPGRPFFDDYSTDLTVTLGRAEMPEIDVKATLTRTKGWTDEAARAFLGLQPPATFRASSGVRPGDPRSGRTLEAAVSAAVHILNGEKVVLIATDARRTEVLRKHVEGYVKTLGGTVKDGALTTYPVPALGSAPPNPPGTWVIQDRS